MNPDDFIITRKRKKYRFALFANSPFCFEYDEWLSRPKGVRGSTRQTITVELGAGTGLFSVELASKYPEETFVAIDVKGDRLQKGARQAEEKGLTNVFFLRARADQLPELFEENSLKTIWLTFPDPFPKKRAAGRRMTHPTFLRYFTKMLKPSGSLYLKHDDRDFFHWSLEQLVSSGWRLRELSFDLHESDLPDDYKIKTTYEKRWLGEGRPTNFVHATIVST